MQDIRLIVMGGSWGGIQASLEILKDLPGNYSIPIILVLHRLRTSDSGIQHIFAKKIQLEAREIEEKEAALPGKLYLAPANYHVLLEQDLTFSLDSSELVNYSRPSIDVTFKAAAQVRGPQTAGILLSGASSDGSKGLLSIAQKGGIPIVQHPEQAEVGTMPRAAIEIVPDCRIFTIESIKAFLNSLHESN